MCFQQNSFSAKCRRNTVSETGTEQGLISSFLGNELGWKEKSSSTNTLCVGAWWYWVDEYQHLPPTKEKKCMHASGSQKCQSLASSHLDNFIETKFTSMEVVWTKGKAILHLEPINSINVHHFVWLYSKSTPKAITKDLDLVPIRRYNCKPRTWFQLWIPSHHIMIHGKNKINLVFINPRTAARGLGLFPLVYIKEAKWSKATVVMPWTFCLVYNIWPILQFPIIEFSRRKASYLHDKCVIEPLCENILIKNDGISVWIVRS